MMKRTLISRVSIYIDCSSLSTAISVAEEDWRFVSDNTVMGELACSYASLILHDEEIPVTAEKIQTLLKAANVSVEPYWPGLFAKLAEKRNLDDFILNVGAGGGGAPVATVAPAGGAAPAAAAAAPAAEEKKKEEPEEESDEDLGLGLFD